MLYRGVCLLCNSQPLTQHISIMAVCTGIELCGGDICDKFSWNRPGQRGQRSVMYTRVAASYCCCQLTAGHRMSHKQPDEWLWVSVVYLQFSLTGIRLNAKGYCCLTHCAPMLPMLPEYGHQAVSVAAFCSNHVVIYFGTCRLLFHSHVRPTSHRQSSLLTLIIM